MDLNSDFLENIWDEILSRKPARIQRAYKGVDTASQNAILSHLHTMVSEEGWQEVQIASANQALISLGTIEPE